MRHLTLQLKILQLNGKRKTWHSLCHALFSWKKIASTWLNKIFSNLNGANRKVSVPCVRMCDRHGVAVPVTLASSSSPPIFTMYTPPTKSLYLTWVPWRQITKMILPRRGTNKTPSQMYGLCQAFIHVWHN